MTEYIGDPSDFHEGNIYEYFYTCSNCGTYHRVEIMKGTTVEDYAIGKKCAYCHCEFYEGTGDEKEDD
jgi:hypothetical protein